ncbi:MAG: hypothetical protein JWO95_1331 [Verrucomicrobiales bacterium]|nr:hypothetical protein [Verrucomicrobiales bacterium]
MTRPVPNCLFLAIVGPQAFNLHGATDEFAVHVSPILRRRLRWTIAVQLVFARRHARYGDCFQASAVPNYRAPGRDVGQHLWKVRS